ncbi:hypothetical protein RQM59_00050 [Flavobacteriaceae bacterium S356]|uniref:TonB C-terminal domain-containing protein n=1 Tax=Asprobacillus argus TaxID=3076534 RepID=A0ABU3LBT2_9FLAO|nr:hypothetical protein [Flavobacteriaceae bacterium S356]
MRFILIIIIVCFLTSCEFFTKKKVDDEQKLDSISFTSVDKAPSFKVCDSIFEKTAKNDCFRNTMYLEITKSLGGNEIKVKKDIDEIIQVVITIGSDKTISLKSIEASQNVYVEIPNIQEIIKKSILDLPNVFPARKRGIPVTSEYTLPIRIQLKN